MSLSKEKILIVEDSPIHMDLLSNAIEEDYIVDGFHCAESAIKYLKEIKPALIISDIILPGMSGLDFLKIIKKSSDTKDIPIIFISALNNSHDEFKGIISGAVDYVYKPFNRYVLKAKIDNQIALRNKFNKKIEEFKNINIDESIDLAIKSMSMYFNFKISDSIEHNKRTGYNMKILADALSHVYPDELTEEKIQLLCKAATLHDIGKIGISDSILYKESILTNDEFNEIKNHCRLGAEIIEKIREMTGESEFLSIARLTILYHHERWDGSGYPYALKGKNIPLYGRIMSILDVYDALRSKRPYKPPFSHKKSVDIILNGDSRISPDSFDPDILAAFKKIHNEFIY